MKTKKRLRQLKVFSGNAHPELAKDICRYLKIPLGKINLMKFSDGEVCCQIKENVRGHVFVIQPTCPPVNQNLVELLVMLDAFKRASAARVTAVIPYYGYARQDRKDKPRVPISAKLVADLISVAGATRVLVMDLHAAPIQGFFNIPVDHLFAAPVLIKYLAKLKIKNMVIVSPDAGGVERARAFAKRLRSKLAIIDKRRTAPNVALTMNVIGDVQGKTAIIIDDIIDTGGTLISTCKALKQKGAKEVMACFIHGVLSGKAIENIKNKNIKKVIITNTIPFDDHRKKNRKILCLSIAPLLGKAIRRIHTNSSVSSLFV
ncbi:MAG: ribose-phosphate pyrophosphokinase [Candidatus Zixiibacteriota bacterium]